MDEKKEDEEILEEKEREEKHMEINVDAIYKLLGKEFIENWAKGIRGICMEYLERNRVEESKESKIDGMKDDGVAS